MKALVLCAGLGTRLRPLTEKWPKPALPLLGRPLIAYHLAALKAAGVTALGINTHHLPEVMEACAQQEADRLNLPLHVVREEVIQGTGGGIWGLRSFLADGDFVVWNGDNFYDLDLAPVIAAHRASGALATLVLRHMPQGEKFAAVELNAQHQVRRISGFGPGGEGLSPWHFAGVHVINPAIFDFMRGVPEDINQQVYPRAIEAGQIVCGQIVEEGYWSDLGTPGRYLKTQADLLKRAQPLRLLESLLPPPMQAQVDATAQLGPQALLDASSYVGPRATIGARARLTQACVLEDTRVQPDEVLERAIAWGSHRILA